MQARQQAAFYSAEIEYVTPLSVALRIRQMWMQLSRIAPSAAVGPASGVASDEDAANLTALQDLKLDTSCCTHSYPISPDVSPGDACDRMFRVSWDEDCFVPQGPGRSRCFSLRNGNEVNVCFSLNSDQKHNEHMENRLPRSLDLASWD